MQRVTITLDDDLAESIDQLVATRGYQGRSEAIRDLARAGLQAAADESAGECVAALVYTYDHESRSLSRRLTQIFHDHHDLSVSTLHVHLDHGTCLEVSVLRGDAADVRHLGEHVIAERGVHYGRLVVTPVEIETAAHSHGRGNRSRRHQHTHVRTGG
jgi:CopG family transcriptional regulator, nickel-responsive regulator